MDRDAGTGTGWDAWAGWASPTAATPAALLLSLLRAAGRRLAGRRVTVPGTGGELSVCVGPVHAAPEPVGLALGQLGEVRVEATGVRWRGLDAHRVVLVAHNVHVRPLPVPAVVAAPVTVEVRLSPEVVRDRVVATRPALLVSAGSRVHWAARPGWGWLAVTPEVTAEALLVRPRALHVGRRRVPLPAWSPVARIALPALPRGLLLREVAVEAGDVVLRLQADQWCEPLVPDRLATAIERLT